MDEGLSRELLPYDVAAYEEGMPASVPGATAGRGAAWDRGALLAEVERRAGVQLARRELRVRYYRIGYTLAFPLPLRARPAALPADVPGLPRYLWTVWLSWALEERWRTLHLAWRRLGDAAAGARLQEEIDALAAWSDLRSDGGEIHLATGHLAGCLNLCLSEPAGWDLGVTERAAAAAQRLLHRDLEPWWRARWAASEPLGPDRLHNIPFIVLVRGAALARSLGSPAAPAWGESARRALHAWFVHRLAAVPHTEGPAYDGYLMDSVTDWLRGEPDRAALLRDHRPALDSLARAWTHLALPGRPELLAPLGDVEPQMRFHLPPLLRLLAWGACEVEERALTRLSARWLPASGLEAMLELLDAPPGRDPHGPSAAAGEPGAGAAATVRVPSSPAPRADRGQAPAVGHPARLRVGEARAAAHPSAVTLRTGWSEADVLVAVGASRGEMGHLHADGGHVVIGWRGRFWLTDPGYQQYREGLEREYTLGPEAHNGPVVGGVAQGRRAAALRALEGGEVGGREHGGEGAWGSDGGVQHVGLDLTACYTGLPAGTRVERDVWLLATAAGPVVAVRDRVAPAAPVVTHWHGGAALAWAFVDGWARLSDGLAALWLGAGGAALQPDGLYRHAGSRGPLTLVDADTVASDGPRWRVFWLQADGGWRPPEAQVHNGTLRLRLPGGVAVRSVAADDTGCDAME